VENYFLHGEVWYIPVVCPLCGEVEEQVGVALAKTPRKAGVLASERHAVCFQKYSDEQVKLSAAAEIEVARQQLEQQKLNLADWEAKLKAALAKKQETAQDLQDLQDLQAKVERHTRGLQSAYRRLAAIEVDNAPKTAG
jgi:hypothetical protein